MGQKLGAFLRVLGSGLSPQAFQANVGMYQQEKAEEAQVAQEGRAEESAIKQMGIKQAFANLGVLGIAAKKANEEGDTEQSHRIGLAAKEVFDKIDPRYRGMAMDSFMAYTLEADKDKKRGQTIALWKPDQPETRTELRLEDKNVDVLMSQGYVKAPTQQLTGDLSSSGKNKLTLLGIEGEQGVRNNVREIGNLMDTVASKDFVGGLTGDAIQSLNSARQQVTQLFGGENYLTEDGKINPSAFAEDSTMRAKAIKGEVAESQTLELAFIIAKSLNPDGKISDADVRQAGQILGDSADPKSRYALLSKVQKRIVDRYNSDQTVIARRLCNGDTACMRQKFTPLKLKDLTGSIQEEKPKIQDTVSNMLKKSGF